MLGSEFAVHESISDLYAVTVAPEPELNDTASVRDLKRDRCGVRIDVKPNEATSVTDRPSNCAAPRPKEFDRDLKSDDFSAELELEPSESDTILAAERCSAKLEVEPSELVRDLMSDT